jgi:hypothetical protein
MNGDLTDIKELILDLGWEYDRMSQSGQETYEKLLNIFGIE